MRRVAKLLQKYSPVSQKANVERWISKYLFGNTVECYANIIGVDNWYESRQAFPQYNHLDLDLHRQFKENGYVVLSQWVDPIVVEKLRNRYLELIENEAHAENPHKKNPETQSAYNHGDLDLKNVEYTRHFKDVVNSIPAYSELFTESLIHKIQSCLASNFMIDDVYAWRNLHCPPEVLKHFEPGANRWHFDDQYADRLKMFLYLSDVTLEDGPFQHFNKAYSRNILMKGFKKEARKYSITGGVSEKYFNDSKIIKHVGTVGTVVLCATSFCLHRGGEVGVDRYRDVIQYCLRPSKELQLTVQEK
jgi:hypothetical protein